jgi:hypothetical protein
MDDAVEPLVGDVDLQVSVDPDVRMRRQIAGE